MTSSSIGVACTYTPWYVCSMYCIIYRLNNIVLKVHVDPKDLKKGGSPLLRQLQFAGPEKMENVEFWAGYRLISSLVQRLLKYLYIHVYTVNCTVYIHNRMFMYMSIYVRFS